MGLSGILTRPRKQTPTSQGVKLGQVIALANQKGGVAKTTTTLNLAVAFREQGFNVLAVDLDPQGNLTMSQGMDPGSGRAFDVRRLVHSLPSTRSSPDQIDLAVVVDRPRRRRARPLEHDRCAERALQKGLLPAP